MEVLRLLDGIVDIYLPDLKYAEDEMGYRYSGVKEYVKYSRLALMEMYRQMGSELVGPIIVLTFKLLRPAMLEAKLIEQPQYLIILPLANATVPSASRSSELTTVWPSSSTSSAYATRCAARS